jgi:hypothetical protein
MQTSYHLPTSAIRPHSCFHVASWSLVLIANSLKVLLQDPCESICFSSFAGVRHKNSNLSLVRSNLPHMFGVSINLVSTPVEQGRALTCREMGIRSQTLNGKAGREIGGSRLASSGELSSVACADNSRFSTSQPHFTTDFLWLALQMPPDLEILGTRVACMLHCWA